MSPTSPWKTTTPVRPAEPSKSKSGFPELHRDYGGATNQYESDQDHELVALEAIYGEDYETVPVPGAGAWKKFEPCFRIIIKSDDNVLSAALKVLMTATYPKSIPVLTLEDSGSLSNMAKRRAQTVIEMKPKELVKTGQPMIHDIVETLRDVLNEAASAKAAGNELPSLEEERATQEAEAAKLAKEEEDREASKKRQETIEEERVLGNMVQEELKRQRTKAKEAKRKSKVPSMYQKVSIDEDTVACSDKVVFDHPITITDESNDTLVFQAVTGKFRIRSGPVADSFTVRPILSHSTASVPTLILKQGEVKSTSFNNATFKKQLQSLEEELEIVKKLHHRNLLKFFAFAVQREHNVSHSDSPYTISVLCEYANKGSLEELLELSDCLMVDKVRMWTIDLLDALKCLHDHGVVHGSIHAANILLVRSPTGEFTIKLADGGYQRQLYDLSEKARSTSTLAKSAYWLPPEHTDKPQYTQKTDIWDFGIVFLQMIFGLTVLQKYSSPSALAESLNLSAPLQDFVSRSFKADPKKRPRAYDLSACEFLATDAPVLASDSSTSLSRVGSMSSLMPPTPGRMRHGSMSTAGPLFSRYKEDFVEEGRLGEGGFGSVVRAKRRLDGLSYAVKKVTQRSSAKFLTEVLKEVRMLSQLSSPYIVRYYNAWTEETPLDNDEEAISTDEPSTSGYDTGTGPLIEFATSTGGLDFISSRGDPQIQFGYGSEDETEEDDDDDISTESTDEEDDEDQSESVVTDSISQNRHRAPRQLALQRTRSDSKQQKTTKTTLYIQMEYCEKRTLRDFIKHGLYKDDEQIWRLFRQILEGLVHIHGMNVVHRDLKPENIFISGADNVKIGDFGLATPGQYAAEKVSFIQRITNGGDITRSIGTPFYAAPEVRSSVNGSYNSKVDMYSLGIIFFEMNYPSMGGMERATVLRDLRSSEPALPDDFNISEKPMQADIVMSLVVHNPKERPSASEVLQSGKLPVPMESEIIRQALAGLYDPASPYYQKIMKGLFDRPMKQAQDIVWDLGASAELRSTDLLLQSVVKTKLISLFRHHGAVETYRSVLFPSSGHYTTNVVKLLDPNGTLVQLPYDLTLPHAREIAKHRPTAWRTYAFGLVYRPSPTGSKPYSFGEVDFDIISPDTLDLALKEAEVIKVLDEIIIDFPSLTPASMCFVLNHSDLLDLIFDFCRIDIPMRPAVAETLSKLNLHAWTWQKIRNELRSPLIGVSTLSLDDLQQFDFRDTPTKCFSRLRTIFEGTDMYEKASPAIAHMKDIITYLKRFGLQCKVYVSPLSNINKKFYQGGMMFQCLYDTKRKDVFAAGGRYDNLILEHRPGGTGTSRHAVGFNLAWEKLVTSMARIQKSSSKSFLKKAEEELRGVWATKRCDVLVASFDASILRSAGIDVLKYLWSHDISAEIAVDSRSAEDLLSKYSDGQHSWIIIVKSASMYKVKTVAKNKEDADLTSIGLLCTWLRNEIRERDHQQGIHEKAKLVRNTSQPDTNINDHSQEVKVLAAQTRSKKSNRRAVVEQAISSAQALTQSFLDGPIAAIETTEHVMDMIKQTRLSDPETWRRVSQDVPMSERRYIGEVHDILSTFAHQNKDKTRNAFVFNFRTGSCIYYDLGA